MRKMTKLLIPALIAAAAIAGANPAAAQGWQHNGQHNGSPGHFTPARAEAIRAQLNELQRRVERNDRRDNLSGREYAGLRHDIASVRNQFQRANRNGLTDVEFRVLSRRIDNIRARLRMERADWNDHRN